MQVPVEDRINTGLCEGRPRWRERGQGQTFLHILNLLLDLLAELRICGLTFARRHGDFDASREGSNDNCVLDDGSGGAEWEYGHAVTPRMRCFMGCVQGRRKRVEGECLYGGRR